jgi:ABC-type Fe3+ transport system substrate-binding protein
MGQTGSRTAAILLPEMRRDMFRIAQLLSGAYLTLALLVTLVTIFVGPILGGTAPLAGMREQLIGRDPVVVRIAYGTEKEEWLQAATRHFLADSPTVQGRPIEIELEGIGSREMVTEIIQGNLQPAVVSPASSIQIELLRDEWQTRNGTRILHGGDDAPQPLVITPLVVVAWEERARALELDDPDRLWRNLHDVLADPQGWASFGHPEWGLAKFGQTTPESSNSGIQALVLMAYAYHGTTSGLTNESILDPGFQEWLDEIQEAVIEFPSSTGTLMEDVVRFGPSKYHFVIVYENLAIANIETARGRGGEIKVYYPPANMLSDHPYAILDAPWVTPEQRAAAAQFRAYLLSEETQRAALVDYGFRPANTAVAFDAAGSPFTRFASYGIQTDIAQSVEVPPANVLNELINLWGRKDYQ